MAAIGGRAAPTRRRAAFCNTAIVAAGLLALGAVSAAAQNGGTEENGAAPPTGVVSILHIDVGQGDATLILGPQGRTLLIDGGNTGKGRRIVAARLADLRIDRLDYLLASHYDADHIGGLDEVMMLMRDVPSAVIDAGGEGPYGKTPTKAFRDYVAAAGDTRTTVRMGRIDPSGTGPMQVDLGAGVNLFIAAADGCVYDRVLSPDDDGRDENSRSLALVLNFGAFDYFVGGDLTGGGRSGRKKTQDLETPTAGIVGAVDVLRINHHGSQTSSNDLFLTRLDPQAAVISVGEGGMNRVRYMHPRREVLDRLHRLHTDQALRRVYLTTRGETDGGLEERDDRLLEIAQGDVLVVADTRRFFVNGDVYAADGRSAAAFTGPGRQQECDS